jgi:4-diphosphocytidyl-2-C-methyl-D-erythritol kinase
MSPPRRARVRAFAKINLDLRVLAQRPDGYHELRTVFQTISLADDLEVSFTPGRATRIEVAGTPDIPDRDNLVVKAAARALDVVRRTGLVRMRLAKRIPMGAGLGGGSSDAAAVLLALPVLAGGRADPAALLEAGAALGSDVPFFLQGGAAVGIGRGTEFYPLADLPARHGLVATPPVHSSTAEAYRALDAGLTTEAQQNKIFSFQSQAWAGVWGEPRNDFEKVVFARHPELARWKRRLARAGARPAMMTGSGSAVFGLFGSREEAARVLGEWGEEAVLPITLIGRARYRSLWRRRLAAHTVENEVWPPQSRYAR